MKPTNRLPKIIRWMFFAFELLALLGVAGSFILALITVALPGVAANIQWGLPPVGLVPQTGALSSGPTTGLTISLPPVSGTPESGALAVQLDPPLKEEIAIVGLQGSVVVKNSSGIGGVLSSISEWYGPPLLLIWSAFLAVLFDLLRRLFRHVEQGDSFTERNIRLVHRIGLSIIAFTLISSAANGIIALTMCSCLNHNPTVEGIRMTFIPAGNITMGSDSHHFVFQFGFSGILAGLLVLALGEVFRQGLLLKQENELTI